MKKSIINIKKAAIILMLLFSFLIDLNASAQSYINAFDFADSNFMQHSAVKTELGEIVIVGTLTPGVVSGNSDIVMIKLDSSGNILWSNYVDYGEDEFAGSLVIDPEENIVLVGYKGQNGGSSPNKDLIIVKFNTNGELIAESVIVDSQLGYSLYGMDIEYIKSGICDESSLDYIVVGTGANGATAMSSKFGFVLKIDSNLTDISWGYSYQSENVTNEYDSFNHILKMNHPWGIEAFLLTGSGKGNFSWYPEGQMVTNDLINLDGVSLWKNAKSSKDPSPFISNGVMALYRQDTNTFYVLNRGGENDVLISEIDAHSGNNTGNNLGLHNHEHDSYIITGMDWMNQNQTKIILSGYRMNSYSYPSNYEGAAIFVEIDLLSFPQPNSVNWASSMIEFSGLNLQNLTFDHIVQPINYNTGSVPYHVYNQLYTPKSSFFTVADEYKVGFVTPYEDILANIFNASFHSIDLSTSIEDECFYLEENTHEYNFSVEERNNFKRQPHYFEIGKNKPEVVNIPIESKSICYDREIGGKSNKSDSSNDTDYNLLKVYPNPTTDFIYIDSNKKIEEVVVYNVSGQMFEMSYENKDTLDFSNYSSGIYFVKVKTDDEEKVFKVIKK